MRVLKRMNMSAVGLGMAAAIQSILYRCKHDMHNPVGIVTHTATSGCRTRNPAGCWTCQYERDSCKKDAAMASQPLLRDGEDGRNAMVRCSASGRLLSLASLPRASSQSSPVPWFRSRHGHLRPVSSDLHSGVGGGPALVRPHLGP